MAGGCTACAPLGGDVAVAVLDGIESLLNVGVDVGIVHRIEMAETDIYHKQRLRTQIFRKLQEFMEAHAVGAGVSPVVVVVAGALLNRADGLLPFEAVVVLGRTVALDVASARKADKRRLHRLKHFGQVAPASVGTATERGRERLTMSRQSVPGLSNVRLNLQSGAVTVAVISPDTLVHLPSARNATAPCAATSPPAVARENEAVPE